MRSVSRQLFELRSRQVRVEGKWRARQRDASRAKSRQVILSKTELARRSLLQRRGRAKESAPTVLSLAALCATRIAAELEFLQADEDLDLFSWFPGDVKAEILKQASRLAEARGSYIVRDEMLGGLLEPSMRELDLSYSGVTDDFVSLIEPRINNLSPGESWESIASLEVRGLSRLVDLNLAFCPRLTEDAVEQLAGAAPMLRRLGLAGNFNGGESAFYLLTALKRLSSLEYLDLACCFWVSLDLMVQAGFLALHSVTPLPELRVVSVEECPEMTAVMARVPVEAGPAHAGLRAPLASIVKPDGLLEHRGVARASRALEVFDVAGGLNWSLLLRANKRTLRFLTSFDPDCEPSQLGEGGAQRGSTAL